MIREVIVVEGRDDGAAVKRAVEAEVIITHGFGLTEETLEQIRRAHERCGVIVLTDPDHAGEKIRRMVGEAAPGAKHAFIPREKARKDGDVGVENASPEAIREALAMARAEERKAVARFGQGDLLAGGLLGCDAAAERRDRLGRILGLGHANGKQLLNRLNHYGVTREEFEAALAQLAEKEGP